ncbi:nucleotidyltransferase family protein [Plebeiibacterium sediminum]|uniref:Nucleotidyltransferase domain-containing protein n=1 Tax=Plebeiibacterium sediminum TaxID=2992112 RepID=A0AAE3M6C4_9BACT|nr:nucleotidyltransferase domain-containing protein [Plebeiobacterium sediminum]MCW3787791.1 nucleotidyltransferase domain-containing protein [Plebeiobacterium sediminum]
MIENLLSLFRMKLLNQYTEQIKRLCELNKVKTLFAFGSITTDDFRPDSDIDLIVDIEDSDPISYSDKYFNLKFQLEDILKRHIDLLEKKAIRNRFLKKEIDQTKVLIYGNRD